MSVPGKYLRCVPCLHIKKEQNGKPKHHILAFSGSGHHIPIHSSLIPVIFIPVSLRFIPPRSVIFRPVSVCSNASQNELRSENCLKNCQIVVGARVIKEIDYVMCNQNSLLKY